jgi:DNA-binding CsgD family transcriptional regulator
LRSSITPWRCGWLEPPPRPKEGSIPTLIDIKLPLPLTRRDREVATLAASGLSNKEIAERLVLSARTVGNHLHSIYAKLHINGRGELREFPELTWPQPRPSPGPPAAVRWLGD